jgi:hypothetical protein
MANNSPEGEKTLRVTVDRIVTIKKSDEQGEYVALEFGLIKDEEAARETYFEYVAAIQEGYEALARRAETKFLTLTHLSVSEVYKKAQEKWIKLGRKNVRATS